MYLMLQTPGVGKRKRQNKIFWGKKMAAKLLNIMNYKFRSKTVNELQAKDTQGKTPSYNHTYDYSHIVIK